MADTNIDESGMDMPAHERSYERFLGRLKQSTIATVIVAAIVIYLLAR